MPYLRKPTPAERLGIAASFIGAFIIVALCIACGAPNVVNTNRDHRDARICVTALDASGRPAGPTVCTSVKAAR